MGRSKSIVNGRGMGVMKGRGRRRGMGEEKITFAINGFWLLQTLRRQG